MPDDINQKVGLTLSVFLAQAIEIVDDAEGALTIDECFARATTAITHLITEAVRQARIDEWRNLSVIDWCNLRAPDVRRLRDERLSELIKEES